MTFAKSKLISSTPDYFICGANDASGKLREATSVPTINTGNYGYLTIYYV